MTIVGNYKMFDVKVHRKPAPRPKKSKFACCRSRAVISGHGIAAASILGSQPEKWKSLGSQESWTFDTCRPTMSDGPVRVFGPLIHNGRAKPRRMPVANRLSSDCADSGPPHDTRPDPSAASQPGAKVRVRKAKFLGTPMGPIPIHFASPAANAFCNASTASCSWNERWMSFPCGSIT